MTTIDKDNSKLKPEDIVSVQETLKEVGAIIDADLFPLIKQAEKGDIESLHQLFNLFVFGSHNVQPNYALAQRCYNHRLLLAELDEEDENDNVRIALAKIDEAYMKHTFEDYKVAHRHIIEAFRFMVTECDFEDWDLNYFNFVGKLVDLKEDYDELDL